MVSKSASIIVPGKWERVRTSRMTRSRKNSASRRICLVFLKATGSKDISMADFESQKIGLAPGHGNPNSISKLYKNRSDRPLKMLFQPF